MAVRYDASRWKSLTNAVHNSYLTERLKDKFPAFFFYVISRSNTSKFRAKPTFLKDIGTKNIAGKMIAG